MSILKNSLKGILTFNAAIGAIALMTVAAQAGPGDKGHGHGPAHGEAQETRGSHGGAQMNHDMPGGMPGDMANVSRTVVIIAKDNKFNLKKIQVKDGETVRFVIKNKGTLVHEMTIGTPEMQKAHQSEMMKMMDAGHLMADKVMGKMDHSHGNSALVEPGKTGEVIWMFHKGATLEFGCNVPGHYDDGMKGNFVIGG